jgi:hypothetical protein
MFSEGTAMRSTLLALLVLLVACQVDHDPEGGAGAAEGGRSGGADIAGRAGGSGAGGAGAIAVHVPAADGGMSAPAAVGGAGGLGGSGEVRGGGGAAGSAAGQSSQAGAGPGSAGEGGAGQAGAAPPVEYLNFLELHSDAGDFIGDGRDYRYTEADARFTITLSNGALAVSVTGNERWLGHFAAMSSEISAGHYGDAMRGSFQVTTSNVLDWVGEGRGCNALSGSFDIDAIAFDSAMMVSVLELRFDQHCENSSAALRGQLRWHADEQQAPPGPVDPPPADLWQPAPGATPSSGRYVYLTSDPGDRVGNGATYTYTQANAQLKLNTRANDIQIQVTGDERWWGEFMGAQGGAQLQRGYYGDLPRSAVYNPVKGGLDWGGCNTLRGWFAVDQIIYVANAVTSLDLRFEQHCEDESPALHGKIHWQPEDNTIPPGPVYPPPSDLWQPPEGATPTTPRYVYLQSDAGDRVGGGGTHAYTQANAQLMVSSAVTGLEIAVNGDEFWTGDFSAPAGRSQLEPGYYANVTRLQNPARAGLDWYGEGSGCNIVQGWLVIDSVSFESNAVNAFDLRFEQRCDGSSSALHGKIHWSATDPTVPPGPVNPPPGELWAPAPGDTPASGSYVYLTSDQGDPIGGGVTVTYPIDASALSAYRAEVDGNVMGWYGHFSAMPSLSRMQVGYYGDLVAWTKNPVEGSMSWIGPSTPSGECSTFKGWFVVDAITYTADAVSQLDLRFEEHCSAHTEALHGKIHLAP